MRVPVTVRLQRYAALPEGARDGSQRRCGLALLLQDAAVDQQCALADQAAAIDALAKHGFSQVQQLGALRGIAAAQLRLPPSPCAPSVNITGLLQSHSW